MQWLGRGAAGRTAWLALAGVALLVGACVLDRSGSTTVGATGGMGGTASVGGSGGNGGSGGMAECVDAADCGTSDTCINYSCNAGSCEESFAVAGTSCGSALDDMCDGSGNCLLGAGKPCGDLSECFDGFCVDGVCCTTLCGAVCEACAGPGLIAGTCGPQPPAEDFDGECGVAGVCDGDSLCADGEPQQALGLSDSGNQVVGEVAFDSAGNLVVLGSFTGTIDLGGGPRTASSFDVFVAKYDTQGAYLWDTQLPSDDTANCHELAFDAADNIILGGYFAGGLMVGTSAYTSADASTDIFLAELNALDGVPSWSQHLPAADAQQLEGIAVGPGGDIYALVHYVNAPFPVGTSTLSNNGGWDVALLAFDAVGTPAGGRAWGDAVNQYARDLAVDSAGDLILTGYYNGVIGADPNSPLTSQGDDTWIIKLSGATHVFSQSFGSGNLADRPRYVRVDSDDNIVLIGNARGVIDLGGGALPHAGGADIWLLRLDPNGGHLWSASYGAAGDQFGVGLALDDAGSMALTLRMNAPFDMGGGMLPHGGSTDIVVAKLAADGTHLWSASYGDDAFQLANTVAAAPDRRLAIGGQYLGVMTLGLNTLSTTDTAVDGFFALLNP